MGLHGLVQRQLKAKGKTTLKGKRFHNAEDIKKNVTTKLNVVPLKTSDNCFQNFLNNPTHVFKYVEITLNRNKTIFYFLVFFLFSLQSGNFIARPHIAIVYT
jgi:hypothetical protein